MANILNFNKICRACLSDVEPLKDLFSVCNAEVFKFCTSVEISECDKLPKQVCDTCLGFINKIYHFKQVVIRSNSVLKQHSNLVTVKLEEQKNESEIKEVILSELNALEHKQQSADDEKEMNIKIQIKNRRVRRQDAFKSINKKTRMKCAKCDKSFQKYENFEAHMRSHFGKKPDIKCDHCEKSFPTLRSLNSHMRIHSGERKYQCLICGKKFAYLNVLKNHELIHAGIKKHVCHICDAKFVQASNLKAHLETHKNKKNYGCSQCGKRFAQPAYLKIHLIRHTGIKNIACSLCDMRFYVKSDLYKHMRSHSADKPHSCELCDKTFKCKSFLIVHMRTHTGERPFACDLCPKKFMASKDLRNHRMIHTGEKPYKCQLCNQAFIQKSALNRHMKGHEKNVDDTQSLIIRPQFQGAEHVTPLTVAYSQWESTLRDCARNADALYKTNAGC